jgi:hypothetical protein|tara:strand:- start:2216 stop:2398 length:183 start_codon:yes stop_codon:yes gene_type:complete
VLGAATRAGALGVVAKDGQRARAIPAAAGIALAMNDSDDDDAHGLSLIERLLIIYIRDES